jgi:hypothetical protein
LTQAAIGEPIDQAYCYGSDNQPLLNEQVVEPRWVLLPLHPNLTMYQQRITVLAGSCLIPSETQAKPSGYLATQSTVVSDDGRGTIFFFFIDTN